MHTKKLFLVLFIASVLFFIADMITTQSFHNSMDLHQPTNYFDMPAQPDEPSQFVLTLGKLANYTLQLTTLCWTLIVLSLLWFCRNYVRSPQHQTLLTQAQTSTAPKFGGWLTVIAVILAFSLVLSPLLLLFFISSMLSVTSDTAQMILLLATLIEFILIVYLFVLALSFYQKRVGTPRLFIGFITANLIATILMLVTSMYFGFDSIAVLYVSTLMTNILQAIVFIPYFRKSKRVKAAFVRA